jgi:hypothetical protein
MIEQNHDWRYDLKVGQEGENVLSKMLRGSNDDYTVEVKLDSIAHKTGNFYIEYQSRGKDSGLKTTRADYYALMTMDKSFVMMVRTEHLKQALKSWQRKCVARKLDPDRTWRKRGGDNKTSVGMLVPVRELVDEILRAM